MDVKKGDYGFIIPVKITKADFTDFNLTGYTVKMKVWLKGTPSVIKWTLDGSVTDAVKGIVEFLVADTNFTEAGAFVGELELTRAGHVESTRSFPVNVLESPS